MSTKQAKVAHPLGTHMNGAYTSKAPCFAAILVLHSHTLLFHSLDTGNTVVITVRSFLHPLCAAGTWEMYMGCQKCTTKASKGTSTSWYAQSDITHCGVPKHSWMTCGVDSCHALSREALSDIALPLQVMDLLGPSLWDAWNSQSIDMTPQYVACVAVEAIIILQALHDKG